MLYMLLMTFVHIFFSIESEVGVFGTNCGNNIRFINSKFVFLIHSERWQSAREGFMDIWLKIKNFLNWTAKNLFDRKLTLKTR